MKLFSSQSRQKKHISGNQKNASEKLLKISSTRLKQQEGKHKGEKNPVLASGKL